MGFFDNVLTAQKQGGVRVDDDGVPAAYAASQTVPLRQMTGVTWFFILAMLRAQPSHPRGLYGTSRQWRRKVNVLHGTSAGIRLY